MTTAPAQNKLLKITQSKAFSVIKGAIQAGFITGSGDFFCQGFEAYNEYKTNYLTQTSPSAPLQSFPQYFANGDWKVKQKRLASVAGFGFCFFGPVGSFWYPYLDVFVKTKFPQFKPGGAKFVMTKVVLEELLLAPVYTAAFFPFTNWGQGYGLPELKQKLKDDYVQTLILDQVCWAFISPILYFAVPVRVQLPVASCLAAVESCFFSYVAHNSFSDLPLVGPIADAILSGHNGTSSAPAAATSHGPHEVAGYSTTDAKEQLVVNKPQH